MKIVAHSKKQKKQYSRINSLWDKVQKQRDRNERFHRQMEALVKDYNKTVLPLEKSMLLDSTIGLSHRLMTFFSRKSMAQYHREALGQWIGELLSEIRFWDDAKANELILYFDEMIAKLEGMDVEEIKQERAEIEQGIDQLNDLMEMLHEAGEFIDESVFEQLLNDCADQLDPNSDESYEDQLQKIRDQIHEHKKQSEESLDNDDMQQAFDFDELFAEQAAGAKHQTTDFKQQVPSKRKGRLDQAWLQKLFRKAAKALHPDKEVNPDRKAAKHEMMAQLLEARKNNDVMTLFSLYAEHVDDSEISLNKEEMQHLSELLSQQLVALNDEYFDVVRQSPIHAHIYENFYEASQKKRQQNIKNAKQSIQDQARERNDLSKNLKNLKQLKEVLDQRIYNPLDDFDFLR